jgi:hypothetical protein
MALLRKGKKHKKKAVHDSHPTEFAIKLGFLQILLGM